MFNTKRKQIHAELPGAVVGSVRQKKPINPLTPRRVKQAIIGVIVLALLGGGLVIWHHRQLTQTAALNTKHALLSEAARYLDTAQTPKLAPIAQQIKQQSGYAKDPDYLYVLLTYSINTSDSNNASAYYGQLVKAYKPSKGYDESIRAYARPPKDLQAQVEFLSTQKNQSRAHDFFVQEPQ